MFLNLCYSDAVFAVSRLGEVIAFCRAKAAVAAIHNQRSYWLSNADLNAGWQAKAIGDAIGWASRT